MDNLFGKFFGTMIAEIVGGIAGGIIVWLAYLPHWAATEDKGAKLAVFCTSPAIRKIPANFLCKSLELLFY